MSSLIAAYRVQEALRDATEAVEAAKAPHTADAYCIKREAEEREARRRAAVARMHDFYQARRRAKQAAQAKAAVPRDSGPGWRVCPGPTSHASLEGFVKEVFDLGFMSIPWPKPWRVRWGEVDPDPHIPGSVTLACCVHPAKVIVVDRRHIKGQTAANFTETALHELAHMVGRGDGPAHGPQFERILTRVRQYVHDLDAPVSTPPAAIPAAMRPLTFTPPTGARWTPRGFVSAPELNPTLEYRG
jgi:hypothetical protein